MFVLIVSSQTSFGIDSSIAKDLHLYGLQSREERNVSRGLQKMTNAAESDLSWSHKAFHHANCYNRPLANT